MNDYPEEDGEEEEEERDQTNYMAVYVADCIREKLGSIGRREDWVLRVHCEWAMKHGYPTSSSRACENVARVRWTASSGAFPRPT